MKTKRVKVEVGHPSPLFGDAKAAYDIADAMVAERDRIGKNAPKA